MTALVHKIQDTFSDLWLDLQLKFAGPKKEVSPPTASAPTHMKLSSLRMSSKGRLFFYDQMATLIDSGVTLIDALYIVLAQEKSKKFRNLYKAILHHINAGMTFADAMDFFPSVFPKMQVALIRAGEKSGNLKLVLAELVEEMESSDDFFSKIKAAMFYPIILILLSIGLVVGMMTLVIPKLAEMYADAGVPLPRLTQAVIDVSAFIVNYWKVIFPSILGIILILVFFFGKVKPGRLLWEKFIYVLPIVGKINRKKNIMIIASNMAMLMKSGVLISDAFAITEDTLGNLHYKRALAKIRQGVVMGKEVSSMMGLENLKEQKFHKDPLFPLQVAQLIHIGESTGTIPKMLAKIQHNYHKQIQYTLKNISTVIEPLMIFVVAALVGSILLAVMLPFFYIGTTVS